MFECARCYETHVLNGKLLAEIEQLKTQRDELRDISGCPPHSTLEAWLATLFATLDESHTMHGEIQQLKRVVTAARAANIWLFRARNEDGSSKVAYDLNAALIGLEESRDE
uniref:Uncharacterized protein n=1 Tax=viral metagenome TaxID=1070528 RepID=A0A6M3KX09_9ZZZZ